MDRIVVWSEGRSEIGPRTLGHRTLLANPKKIRNRELVNNIKTREKWRPFAPAVLEDDGTINSVTNEPTALKSAAEEYR